MSAQGVVNVKAYLERSESEIRRFTLDHDVSTSYEYLKGKVSTMFPSLNREPFTVYWKDDENDLVSISSDEELEQALMYGNRDGLFRLIVRADAASQGSSAKQPKVEHPGVVCDSCDAGIVGLRFKCLVCADYDLCSSCCDRGQHDHHYLLRIATPAGEFDGARCRQGRGRGWGPWGASGAGPNVHWGNMRKWMRNMRNGWTAGANGGPCAGQADAPPPAPQGGAAEPSEQERDYLQHVGEQVSAMLEPLGINVDVGVEERAAQGGADCRPRGGRGRWRQHGGRHGRPGADGSCSRGGACRPDPTCSAADGKPDGSCTRGGCKPDAACKKEKCKKAASADMEITVDGATGSRTVNQKETTPSDEDEESQSWVKVEEKEVMVVDKPVTQAEGAGQAPLYPSLSDVAPATSSPQPQVEASAPTPNVAPAQPLPAAQQIPSFMRSAPSAPEASGHPDLEQRVKEAQEQMRAMGFHDDGGWMTALLYQHNGNVYKVIDSVLQATHRHN